MPKNTPHEKAHIEVLREHLLGTLADLRRPQNPMPPDQAKAIAMVASVIVDTAKVEVEYLKATNQDKSNFLDGMTAPSFNEKLEHQK